MTIRQLHGSTVAPFETRLSIEYDNKQSQTVKPLEGITYRKVVELTRIGLFASDIVKELSITKSSVSKYQKRSKVEGLLSDSDIKTERRKNQAQFPVEFAMAQISETKLSNIQPGYLKSLADKVLFVAHSRNIAKPDVSMSLDATSREIAVPRTIDQHRAAWRTRLEKRLTGRLSRAIRPSLSYAEAEAYRRLIIGSLFRGVYDDVNFETD